MTHRIARPYRLYGEGGIALSKSHRSLSLSIQLFIGVLYSLLIAFVVFCICFWIGQTILDKTVYRQAFIGKMTDQNFHSLENYIASQKVSSTNLKPLDIWCKKGDIVYLTVYNDEKLIYEYPSSSEISNDNEEENNDLSIENIDNEYSITFSDGIKSRAFLYYYTSDAYYYCCIVLSIMIAFIIFSFFFISFVHKKVRYIKQLKTELDILAGGDLQYKVTIKGNDELSELANGIDQMRKSILAHQDAENKVRIANSDLVTAMSHDLRTPLTSLLAYLELMERSKYEDASQLQHFISRSLEKALQIKDMADKLFEYFLVYSSEWEQPDMESLDADSVFQQFWGEYTFSFESKGFQVVNDFMELRAHITVNIDLLRRAFDNLYSNIIKYANLEMPIEISYYPDDNKLYFIMKNSISKDSAQQESTNIGLNTCQRIIQYHNGSFQYQKENDSFKVIITLPLV